MGKEEEANFQKVRYDSIDKESLTQLIKRILPKELIPTKRVGVILGVIFLAVILLSLVRFPLGKMLKGDVNFSIVVGEPLTFLEFSLTEPNAIPLRIPGLIGDLLIYIILSYAIDVALNFILKTPKYLTKSEKKNLQLFESKRPILAEKAVTKIIKDNNK